MATRRQPTLWLKSFCQYRNGLPQTWQFEGAVSPVVTGPARMIRSPHRAQETDPPEVADPSPSVPPQAGQGSEIVALLSPGRAGLLDSQYLVTYSKYDCFSPVWPRECWCGVRGDARGPEAPRRFEHASSHQGG